MEATATASKRASEEKRVGMTDFAPNHQKVVVPRKKWRWWVAIALPLLLPFFAPESIVTKGGHNNHRNGNGNGNSINNRQLLEHGLRGDTMPSNGKGDPTNANANANTNANTNPIFTSNTTIPLHAHSGTHHAHLYIGSPPQRQTLIVDTGSRVMAFPCKTCQFCGECCGTHASPYFDRSKSTTHSVSSCGECLLEGISGCPLSDASLRSNGNSNGNGNKNSNFHCIFVQKYTEGSAWKAIEVEDLVWLGSSDAVDSLESYMPSLAVAYPFGCQTSSTGLFRKQYADGILGLSIHETSLVTAFYNEGLIPSNAFSLCFTREGGVMSLGGSLDPEKYHAENAMNTMNTMNTMNMKTTPVTRLREHGYFSVEVIRLVVGNDMIVTDATTQPELLREMNSGKGCILDSGTTDSYFPSGLSTTVRRAVTVYGLSQNRALADQPQNFDLFSSELREKFYTFEEFETLLPTITVVFANEVALTILPKHYMEFTPLEVSSGNVVPWEGTLSLTNRLYFEEPEGLVLGANAFFGYDILFDGGSVADGHEARIGIAPADCHAAAHDAESVATATAAVTAVS